MPINDNGTIKKMIQTMRNKGMTYQEIADTLAKEYGIVRSRQAIYSLYNRSIDENRAAMAEEKQITVSHVVNIYCLGWDMTKTTDAMKSLGVDISYNKVSRIIHANSTYIKNVNEALVTKVKDMIECEDDPAVIKASLSYCGIDVTSKKLGSLISQAFKLRIRDYILKEIVSAYKLSGDKEVAKDICYSYPNSKITIADIEKYLVP